MGMSLAIITYHHRSSIDTPSLCYAADMLDDAAAADVMPRESFFAIFHFRAAASCQDEMLT